MITKKQIINFIYKKNIQDSVVCLHSSLKSFGKVENGAKDIIDAFLESGCTLVCPAFFYDSATFKSFYFACWCRFYFMYTTSFCRRNFREKTV